MSKRPPDILPRIAAGDTQAVSLCLDEYGGMVLALAQRYLRPFGLDCDDAVQEIFVEIWRHAARFDPTVGCEAAFIATIAHRRLIDRQRRHAAASSVAHTDLGVEHADTVMPAGATAALGRNAEEAREATEAFNQLTHDERQVVWLTVCQGYSHERASRALQTPLGTIKTRARRGLVRMREFLERQRESRVAPAVIPIQTGARP